MIALTANIAIPNINRIRLTIFNTDDLNTVGRIHARVLGVGGKIYGEYDLTIIDGPATSTGLAVNPSSVSYGDALILVPQLVIANAFTNADAAYRGAAGGRAGAFRALEQQGLTDGWLAAALTGPIT
jgi:hypothetical protein